MPRWRWEVGGGGYCLNKGVKKTSLMRRHLGSDLKDLRHVVEGMLKFQF